VGLAAVLAVVTLTLWATGRLALYLNPSSDWLAVPMAVLLLAGAVLSFVLPLGAEADHGHDHGEPDAVHGQGAPDAVHGHGVPDAAQGHLAPVRFTRHDLQTESPIVTSERSEAEPALPHSAHSSRSARRIADRDERSGDPAPAHGHPAHKHPAHKHPARGRGALGPVLAVTGGVAASVVVAGVLLWPPASLSAEIAQTRSTGSAPLFAGADVVQLASRGDTATFGVGDWASVFATATNPDAFEGDAVTLIGFVTPGSGGTFGLTRLVITHCVIDAQTARVPVSAALPAGRLKTGQWVSVAGVVRTTPSGGLEVDARSVRSIPQPKDPYEY